MNKHHEIVTEHFRQRLVDLGRFRLATERIAKLPLDHANRPQVVANYTKDLVYARLAPGIVKQLEERNPILDNGRRKAKHHQWLTEDVGHPALAQHLYAVIGFMRVAQTWDQFLNNLDIAFPKRGDTLKMPFMAT